MSFTKVKKEHDLTISKIMDLLNSKGCFISEATVKRIFANNSDPLSFKYRDTISPLAEVLLDFYKDDSGLEDTIALKALIHEKNKMIDVLLYMNEEQKVDYERRKSYLKKQIERLEKIWTFEKMLSTEKMRLSRACLIR